jgi:hypothetical protein
VNILAQAYLRSAGVFRQSVPDSLVDWNTSFLDYAPPDYTSPEILGTEGSRLPWADSAIIVECRFNKLDGNVNRVSFHG